MKIKLLQIGFVSLLLSLATGCTSALYQSDAYALDDMYGVVDQEALSRQREAEVKARIAAAEMAKARQEAAEEEARQAILAANNASGSVLADTYESAYARRLRGFNSPTYQRPSSSYENIRTDSRFEYLTAYDPAYYNIIVLGDEVWVEPKYITSMFDSWNTPTIYLNFGFGSSSVYNYNQIYFGWGYNPYYDGFNSPAWFWNHGFYNPYVSYPWYYPYWDPYWYYPPYWGYGPGCWWGHHHHYPSAPGHIVSRPNYRRNQGGNRLPSGSFSNSSSGRQFGNSGYRGTSSSVGRGSFSGSGGSSTFRGGSSGSSATRPSNSYRPSNGSSSSSSFRNNSSSRGSSTFRGSVPVNFSSGNSSSSSSSGSSSRYSSGSSISRSSGSYSAPAPSSSSGGSFRGSSGGSFSRGSSGGGGGRSYGR